MKTARELFKKIGFTLKHNNAEEIMYGLQDRLIRFDKEEKYVAIWGGKYTTVLELNLIEAINKQIEELGWNKIEKGN